MGDPDLPLGPDDPEFYDLGTIGDTTVYIAAEGPKSRWCVDVLSEKFEAAFEAVKQQAEAHLPDDE